MSIYPRIALRYLFSKKSHSAVNIISYVSMAGVALATAAMVIVLSVYNGFARFTSDRISDLSPDLAVTASKGKTVEHVDSLLGIIHAADGVADASAMIEERAFAIAGDRQMPLLLRGLDSRSQQLEKLRSLVIDGKDMPWVANYGFSQAMSTVGVANTLQAFPSAPISIKLYQPRRYARLNPSNPMAAFRSDSVIVSEVYRVGHPDYDVDRLVVPLSTAANLLGYEDEATALHVTLAPDAQADAVKAQLSALLGPDLKVADRLEQQQHAFIMINVEKWVTLLMLIFILVIASFNILSTLSMLIVEKRPNRAILSAMGATNARIGSIFAWLAFFITAIGGGVGLLLGTLLSLAQQMFGFIKLNASNLVIKVYPVDVVASDIILVAAITALIGVISACVIRLIMRR